MKSKFFSYLVAGAALSFAACQGSGDGTDTTNDSAAIERGPDNTRVDDNTADTATASVLDNNTRDFAIEASRGGMLEVELGQLAQQKAVHQRVKDFGAMMVRDHTTVGADLRNAVAGKIELPAALTDAQQRQITDLREEKGMEFDREYIEDMVNDHERDIRKFEDIARDSKDAAVRDFANSHLPKLRAHLDSAKAIRNDLKRMK